MQQFQHNKYLRRRSKRTAQSRCRQSFRSLGSRTRMTGASRRGSHPSPTSPNPCRPPSAPIVRLLRSALLVTGYVLSMAFSSVGCCRQAWKSLPCWRRRVEWDRVSFCPCREILLYSRLSFDKKIFASDAQGIRCTGAHSTVSMERQTTGALRGSL